jgi:hypothetical protein
MSLDQNHQETVSSNAGSVAVIANAVVKAVEKQLPSSQEKRGDEKLNQAHDLIMGEAQSEIEEDDISFIEDKIT